MNRIQDSKDFQEIIKNLNKKDYSKALEKIKIISEKYQSENIILKLYAIIYFNLKEWNNAINYYKKCLNFEIEKYKLYTNIGVAYFKLGKINQSIVSFKKSIENNPNFGLAYNNLGISYLELSMFEEAKNHFIHALRLDNNDYQAQINLINTFNFKKPKNDYQHPLIKINNAINNLTKENKILSKDNNNIKIL